MNSCPLCHSGLSPLWPSINFWLCHSCGLKVRIGYGQNMMNELYRSSWQAPQINVSETGGTDPVLARTYMDLLLSTFGRKDFFGLNILDYGAGRGDILSALVERKAQAVGVEPFGHELLRQKGFQTYQTMEDLPENQAVDGIVCVDVIEHLEKPLADIQQMFKLLSPGGWLFISTPNSESLRARIQGQTWEEANRKGHLFLFTPDSLEKNLSLAGFSRIYRLRWFIPYHHRWYRRVIDKMLTLLRLDGELRYLAIK